MKSTRIFLLSCLLCCALVHGCIHREVQPSRPAAPAVFFETPRIEEVIGVVNENSSRIRQLQTMGATLSTQGHDLRAEMAFEKPHRLRLTAGTMLTGAEFDLGSNEALFWLWLDRLRPKAIYFARRSDMHLRTVRNALPISPERIVEAIGILWLDPALPHEGPWRTEPGRIEIRSPLRMGELELWRTLVLDDSRGWILEQKIQDQHGVAWAHFVTGDHRYDAVNGVTLPHQIQISIPRAELELGLRVDHFLVNQPTASNVLFEMPQPTGAQVLNLADPHTKSPFQLTSTQNRHPAARPPDSLRTTSRPWLKRYAGFGQLR